MREMPRTHLAVEQDRLEELRDLLAAGADIHEESNGFTLLHRAVDGEIGGHVQTGEPLHVGATCFLLSQGADPTRRSHGGTGVSAHHPAFATGIGLQTLSSEPGSPAGTPEAVFERWSLDA